MMGISPRLPSLLRLLPAAALLLLLHCAADGSVSPSPAEAMALSLIAEAESMLASGQVRAAEASLRTALTLPLPESGPTSLLLVSEIWTSLGSALLLKDAQASENGADPRVREGLLVEALHSFGQAKGAAGAESRKASVRLATARLAALLRTNDEEAEEGERGDQDGVEGRGGPSSVCEAADGLSSSSSSSSSCSPSETSPPLDPALVSVLGHEPLDEATASRDLAAFKQWLDGSSSPSSSSLPMRARADRVELRWSRAKGFVLRASRDIMPGEEVFGIPSGMLHRGAGSEGAGAEGGGGGSGGGNGGSGGGSDGGSDGSRTRRPRARLNQASAEQRAMLARVNALSREHATLEGRDVAGVVLFWQRLVDAMNPGPGGCGGRDNGSGDDGSSDDGSGGDGSDIGSVTGNPRSGLEPWLRTYRYASMWPAGWSGEELAWIRGETWAAELHGLLWDRRATVDTFCGSVLPTLRAEFPRQFPATTTVRAAAAVAAEVERSGRRNSSGTVDRSSDDSDGSDGSDGSSTTTRGASDAFTCAGFEWCLQLVGSRAIWGGYLVPLMDTMDHAIAGGSNVIGDLDQQQEEQQEENEEEEEEEEEDDEDRDDDTKAQAEEGNGGDGGDGGGGGGGGGYSSHALRRIRRGETLFQMYHARGSNAHFLAHFDFVHPPGVDPGGTRVPATAESLWRAFLGWQQQGRGDTLLPEKDEERAAEERDTEEQEPGASGRTSKGRRSNKRRKVAFDAAWPVALRAHGQRWPFLTNSSTTFSRDLVDDCLLVLLGILAAPDPEQAAREAAGREWQPDTRETDDDEEDEEGYFRASSPAAQILRQWVAQTTADTERWQTGTTSATGRGDRRRGDSPPPSLPPHRVQGARQIAKETLGVLKRASRLLLRSSS